MSNRQTVMQNRQEKVVVGMDVNKLLFKKEFSRIVLDAGYQSKLLTLAKKGEYSEQQDIMFKGRLAFNHLPSGIDIHCSELTEETTGHHVTEVDAGLTINFLLDGAVKFSLENNNYQFKVIEHPLIFVNVINTPLLFTRFFSEGQKVQKLSISVSKSWLYERCKTDNDKKILDKIFFQSKAVYELPFIENTLNLISNLVTLHESEEIGASFQVEEIAFKLFGESYLSLVHLDFNAVKPVNTVLSSVKLGGKNYEDDIAQILHQSLSLKELSVRLGASISTLQRYFKHKHGVTIQEYIRHQKLEHARRSLLFDNKSIGEVAYCAGYNHVSNFIIAFKKYFLMTPSELKAQYK